MITEIIVLCFIIILFSIIIHFVYKNIIPNVPLMNTGFSRDIHNEMNNYDNNKIKESFKPVIQDEILDYNHSPPQVPFEYRKEVVIENQINMPSYRTNTCHFCNVPVDALLPWKCKRCGHIFCSDHRLPEQHECPFINKQNWSRYKELQKKWY